MEGIIGKLREAGAFAQSLAVSAGGLVGVFATLALLFALILLAGKLGKRDRD